MEYYCIFNDNSSYKFSCKEIVSESNNTKILRFECKGAGFDNLIIIKDIKIYRNNKIIIHHQLDENNYIKLEPNKNKKIDYCIYIQ